MGKIVKKDKNLKKYCTSRQWEILNAYWDTGSSRKAAKKLGLSSKTSITDTIGKVLKKAAKAGYSPDHGYTHEVPDGFHVKGVSTLYNANGEIVSQWVKSNIDVDNIKEKLSELVGVFADKVEPLSEIEGPSYTDDDIMCLYPIADLHIGMYAWKEETGNDYDCEISKELLFNALERLIHSAPNSKKAIIVSLGDWFHSDTIENKTLKSGNILDVDTRWQRVFRIGARMLKTSIEMALTKHEEIDVIVVPGNHDRHSSFALSMFLDAYFRNNKRVKVNSSVSFFRYVVFGKNLLGFTHGNVNESKLPGIMAADKPEEWGKTKYRTWFIGHKHKTSVKEYPGCVVEMVRTIASKDAWTYESGFRSERDLQRIVFHRERGEIERARVFVE